jgi:hypothetical protein
MVSQGPDGPKGITSRYETGTQTVCLAIVHRTVTVTDGLTVFWL